MFHSMELVNAIHADRVRDLERALRDRRLLEASLGAERLPSPTTRAASAGSSIQVTARTGRSGSACEVA
jgi:hypothetical protein